MPTPAEIEARFWKALKSDMTMMLGLDGIEDGHARPMTAQLDGERGPIWFFTAKDNAIVQKLGHGPGKGNRAIVTFAFGLLVVVIKSGVFDCRRFMMWIVKNAEVTMR